MDVSKLDRALIILLVGSRMSSIILSKSVAQSIVHVHDKDRRIVIDVKEVVSQGFRCVGQRVDQ